MSYEQDLLKAGDRWDKISKAKINDDVPDPIDPHPFKNAVTEMDQLLKGSWCYKTKGVLMNTDEARKEFFKITNSESITDFLQYWAHFAIRAQKNLEEAQRIGQGSLMISSTKVPCLLRAGRCAVNVLENKDVVKRYVAAYFSVRLNLKYSLAVLAIQGVETTFTADGHVANNPFAELYATIKPDLSMAADMKKGEQISVMALAHAYVGTIMETKSWVNFLTAVKEKKVPRYWLLDRKVEPLDPPDEEPVADRNPDPRCRLWGLLLQQKILNTQQKMPRGHPNYLYGLPPSSSRSYVRTRKKSVRSVMRSEP